MDVSSWSVKSTNPFALRSGIRFVKPPPARGRFARSSVKTSPDVWLHQSSDNKPLPHPLPSNRLHVPEPGTSAPLGAVKKRAILSLQQLSPHALSRTLTLAAVMHGGKAANVCATAALTSQLS